MNPIPAPPTLELRAARGPIGVVLAALMLIPVGLTITAVAVAATGGPFSDAALALLAAAVVGGPLIAALRTRTTVDAEGVTVERLGRRRYLAWSTVAGLAVVVEEGKPRAIVATTVDGHDVALVDQQVFLVRRRGDPRRDGSQLHDLRDELDRFRQLTSPPGPNQNTSTEAPATAQPIEWRNPPLGTFLLRSFALIAVLGGCAVIAARSLPTVAVGFVVALLSALWSTGWTFWRQRPGQLLLAADERGVTWQVGTAQTVPWGEIESVRVSADRRRTLLLVRRDHDTIVLPTPATNQHGVASEVLRRRPTH